MTGGIKSHFSDDSMGRRCHDLTMSMKQTGTAPLHFVHNHFH